MHHLPDEMVCHIFKFSKDRVGTSRACKKWNCLLNDMYKQNLISDLCDPYYFKKYFDKVGLLQIKDDITYINNHNCLNYICDKMFNANIIATTQLGCDLIIKNCQVNNVSNPKYIHFLCNNYGILAKIIDACLKYKAYDMLVIVECIYPKFFASQFIFHYYYETNIDIPIRELEIIMDRNILTINQIYKNIFNSNIFLKKQLLTHLESKMNPDVIKLLGW